ncbi:MAG: Ribosomal RNA small subunit methyltransferase H [Microgenomates group bacterium Gr01-1014_93]|nr:MAG: Ribosomal RNA small subunit methyltransferase H [Microgenomates group bacterium Gr01-1014_93]
MEGYHNPVLLREIIEALEIKPGYWYLDATLGDGGHSLGILEKEGNVIGLDVDPEALDRVRRRFNGLGIEENRFQLIQGNFRDLNYLLQAEGFGQKFKGIIFDLGVSSLQLETPQRGFSFSKFGPLDMRMDPNLEVSALDLIKGLNKGELYELFTKLGEEKFAKAIASALVSSREINSTKELADLVEEIYKNHGVKNLKIHPATKIFQALRIAVNDELNAIKEVLPQAMEVLEINGKIIIISFHSLEDRIVKLEYKGFESRKLGKILTKKPISPSPGEIENNPRSRSAKLRIFQKCPN